MLKKLIFLISIISTLGIYAQENGIYFGNEEFLDNDSSSNSKTLPFIKKDNKLHFGFSAGSIFTNYYGHNILSNYTAPEIRYNFTDRFSLSAGTIFSYSSAPSYFYGENGNNQVKNQNMMNYYMFMQGSYLINDKLRVHGSAIFDLSPQVSSGHNAFNSFGFDYKIGDNTYVSAEVTISNSGNRNPLMHYNTGGMFENSARPYNNSLFSEPFPSW
ncbi:MAG TPA: hypothetical protein PKN32_11290 [Bacteroidales bacterium]|nr:hypothetical protein [Bacteroidales bacterium]